jgi:hypothetical protein
MFCTQCGCPSKPNHRYCGKCGALMDETEFEKIDEASGGAVLDRELNFGEPPSDLSSLDVGIEDITFSRSENSDDHIANITISVASIGDVERGHLKVGVFVFSQEGILLGVSEESFPAEQFLDQTCSVELGVMLDDEIRLDHSPLQFGVSVIAVRSSLLSSDEIEIPTEDGVPQAFSVIDPPSEIEVLSSAVLLQRGAPGTNRYVETRMVVKNNTISAITNLKGLLRVEEEGAETAEALPLGINLEPGEVTALNFSTGVRIVDGKIKLAIVELELEQVISAGYATYVTRHDSLDYDPLHAPGVDAKEFVVRFALTKGEGEWPTREELSLKEAKTIARIAEFVLDWVPDRADPALPDNLIVEAELIYDGVTYSETCECGLRVTDDEISGYPTPIFRFRLSKPVSSEVFRQAIFTSSVSLLPQSRAMSDEEAFFCEDYNGYTEILDGDDLEGVLEGLREDGLIKSRKLTFDELLSGVKLSE